MKHTLLGVIGVGTRRRSRHPGMMRADVAPAATAGPRSEGSPAAEGDMMLSRFRPDTDAVGPRPARGARRTSLATALTATAVGLAVALMDTATAVAAVGDPTISVPELVTGYGRISITGVARPGATVRLHEAAYLFRGALAPAEQEYFPEDIITAVAGSNGAYRLSRVVDSGFVFAVESDGRMSATKTVNVKVLAQLQVSAAGAGGITASVSASPGQPQLAVQLERSSGSAWTTVAEDVTGDGGIFTATLTGQPSGARYRAKVGGDPSNALVASAYTDPVEVGGSGTSGTSTTPTKPSTPSKPTTAAGAVQLTKVVYDSPGKDTGSNTSVNGEYVRLTNRTARTINLRNWTLRDVAGHLYRFTADYPLGAGKNVYVRTGRGTDGKPAGQRYWGSRSYVWNNSGDTAILRDGTNKTIDSCRWTKDRDYTYC
jgi:hypothetical protein